MSTLRKSTSYESTLLTQETMINKSIRSYRSFAKSYTSGLKRTQKTFLKIREKPEAKMIKLKLKQREVPEDEAKLRQNKEKQILIRQKEAAEK
mmetsp:Transcript_14116/g.14123  ORF Transcript_14116/g.14123 Transcript_14116/m.14123 type:complete len:93 (-) Transcript_14116:961-1239(-)